MQTKEYIENICMHIKFKPVRNEIAKELENHIQEQKECYIEEGIENNVAEEMAIKQMGDATEIGKKLNKIHRPQLDWKLLIILVITLAFGLLVTITRAESLAIDNTATGIMTKYIFSLSIAVMLGIAIYFIDYRKIQKHSLSIYIFSTAIIIYTLLFGARKNGIPFLRFGIFYCSASSIAIPLYLIAFVGFIQNINKEKNIKINFLDYKEICINVDFIKIIFYSLISVIMLISIPAVASAFIVVTAYLIITIIKILKDSTNKKKKILNLILIPTYVIFSILILLSVNGPYRSQRIVTSFNPELDPEGSGWHGVQQNLIINSAQLIGEAGNMSNAIETFDEGTNYAFISLLAHYGWIISMSMVIAIMLLNIKIIINATKIKDLYGKLLITAIASMFILKSVCNILMNLNLGIKADFNIPFISYGIANLIIDIMCLSLVLSIYRRKNINLSNGMNRVVNET